MQTKCKCSSQHRGDGSGSGACRTGSSRQGCAAVSVPGGWGCVLGGADGMQQWENVQEGWWERCVGSEQVGVKVLSQRGNPLLTNSDAGRSQSSALFALLYNFLVFFLSLFTSCPLCKSSQNTPLTFSVPHALCPAALYMTSVLRFVYNVCWGWWEVCIDKTCHRLSYRKPSYLVTYVHRFSTTSLTQRTFLL